jgi:bifunctional UDP-N-acetylglucosamine pyrophosphorylase / glucosamine-1-phosphate N-acetyltransferase
MSDVLILAAGLGTRMKSRRAKVLHELCGVPLIAHVVRSAVASQPANVHVVVGYQADEVEKAVRIEFERLANIAPASPLPRLAFVLQAQQNGTGHAMIAARENLAESQGPLVVLAGDGPLIKADTLARLLTFHAAKKNDATMLVVDMSDPTGYGRIVRDDAGRFLRCVEQRDATPEELAITEVGVSIYCFEIPSLIGALDSLTAANQQGEYYLTDVPRILRNQGKRVGLFHYENADEVVGVNTRVELAELERELREAKVRDLMLSGVTIIDPSTVYVHQDVEIGQDTVISPQVIIEGRTRIGSGCTIQSWTRLKNVEIEDSVSIRNCCVIEDSLVHCGATVGPFARIRMNAELGENAGIGNFVEVKKSRIGRRTKAAHLTYLGDATIGDDVNIGAGTVTCNYDGVRKHETVIEDDVKIGSDTMLIAPVRVGRGSVTGAGSVVTHDIPPDSLAFGAPAAVKKKLK